MAFRTVVGRDHKGRGRCARVRLTHGALEALRGVGGAAVSYTHLRAHETTE